MRKAGDLVPPPCKTFPGGLGEAIEALNHVLVDNDAFAF